ncbi:transmembrane protein 252 isoform X1 [Strigops habroptila]|uniref:transmembrane protein 252 isoform X1 n=1 Tax=Strigops habroptila TaxID=2489341 RepID=UPI0011CFE0AE|nr:transmembrane protein 252 isoform X1 [Strigops habroptila]
MPKGVFTFIRLLVLLLSFSTMCLGVLCISTSSSACRCGNNELVFYCLLALGFFLLVAGIFWSTFHEVLKYRGLSSIFILNPSLRELRVSTIDRPDFYPPSYEYSTDPEKQTSPLPVASALKQQEVFNIPPPLYSESSAEFISETNEQEQPPPYELFAQQLQQQQTADQKPNPGGESNSHPSTEDNSYQQDAHCSERATPAKTPETGSGQNPASVKQRKLEEDMCQ